MKRVSMLGTVIIRMKPSAARPTNQRSISSATVFAEPAKGVRCIRSTYWTVSRRVRPRSRATWLICSACVRKLFAPYSATSGNGASRSYWEKSCQPNGRPNSASVLLKSLA